jgi:hypothetical protein
MHSEMGDARICTRRPEHSGWTGRTVDRAHSKETQGSGCNGTRILPPVPQSSRTPPGDRGGWQFPQAHFLRNLIFLCKRFFSDASTAFNPFTFS